MFNWALQINSCMTGKICRAIEQRVVGTNADRYELFQVGINKMSQRHEETLIVACVENSSPTCRRTS